MPDLPGFLFLRMIWDRRETPMPPVRIARMTVSYTHLTLPTILLV